MIRAFPRIRMLAEWMWKAGAFLVDGTQMLTKTLAVTNIVHGAHL